MRRLCPYEHAALDYMRAAGRTRRAEGMAIYTAAFVTAGLCGTSIGGILADRLGYHATFIIATGITLLSAIMLLINLRERGGGAAGAGTRLRLADFGLILAHRGFQLLIVAAAIPTQLLTTGYLFYATPMLLDEKGYSASIIGQVMMIYFIIMILFGVPTARLADRVGNYRLFASAGLMLAGLSALLPQLAEGATHYALWIGLSMALVGLAHAACIPAQGAILLQEAERFGEKDEPQPSLPTACWSESAPFWGRCWLPPWLGFMAIAGRLGYWGCTFSDVGCCFRWSRCSSSVPARTGETRGWAE